MVAAAGNVCTSFAVLLKCHCSNLFTFFGYNLVTWGQKKKEYIYESGQTVSTSKQIKSFQDYSLLAINHLYIDFLIK